MILWLDAHLSPAMAPWLRMRFALDAIPIRDLDLREAEDAMPTVLEMLRSGEALVEIGDAW